MFAVFTLPLSRCKSNSTHIAQMNQILSIKSERAHARTHTLSLS